MILERVSPMNIDCPILVTPVKLLMHFYFSTNYIAGAKDLGYQKIKKANSGDVDIPQLHDQQCETCGLLK